MFKWDQTLQIKILLFVGGICSSDSALPDTFNTSDTRLNVARGYRGTKVLSHTEMGRSWKIFG